MTGFGIRQEDIGIALEIHPKTLRKYYKRELETGAIKANTRVAQALYKNAVQNENVAAQIWWTKTRMGWKEQTTIEHTGAQTPLIELHLIAASAVSAQLTRPTTIQHNEPQPANLLDAPVPTE